jgi:beta-phosphoglucomutase-like phosphatase (HAD superfamily)
MSVLRYTELAGAIYDVDDTLLNNNPNDGSPYNLHDRSRLAAIHAIGHEQGHEALLGVSADENIQAFRDAPTHTVDAAIWLILHRYGVVEQPDVMLDHPILNAIVERKANLHMDVLSKIENLEVLGASQLVRSLETNGLKGKQAIASGARLEEIELFLNKTKMTDIFPRSRILARGDYEHSKPDKEPFDKAFKTLGLPDTPHIRSRVLAIEDDPKGYLSAYAAGLYACAVTTRFPAEAFTVDGHRPHIIAANMQELGEQLGLPME